jgi:hypothetical protein
MMSTLWAIGLGAFLFIAIALPLIIFPILAFVDCVRNPELNTSSKIAWGCLIFFTWVLGATIYGLFGTKRTFYRTMAILSICLIGGSLLSRRPLERYQEKLKTRQSELKAQIAASKADVQAKEAESKELIERKIYFKLPLKQTQFHWRFQNRQAFLSNKLTLILKGNKRTETIDVFKNGEISDGWEVIDAKRNPPGQIYFGFLSTRRFPISALDKVEIKLQLTTDIQGIGPYNKGILKAGNYGSTCTVIIYASNTDTAYTGLDATCAPTWDLVITDNKGWMGNP